MSITAMHELELANKRVIIRADLNVPIKDGEVLSAARIKAALPGIRQALDAGAAVIVLSHLGRPKEGTFSADLSLQPVADKLAELLGCEVGFQHNWLDGVAIEPGQVVLCENVRFNVGEKENSEALAKKIAALGDVFVMDAFATAHRAHASTHGVARFAAQVCGGPLLLAELAALATALEYPKSPVCAIVGGAKVSSKLTVLKALLDKVDNLIVGGGIANTFLAAAGYNVGASLYEKSLLDEAKKITDKIQERGGSIPLPSDVVVSKQLSNEAEVTVKSVSELASDDMILDIGPSSAQDLATRLTAAGTVIWNGPLGVFEVEAFSNGTRAVAEAIAQSQSFSLAGGGDTLLAIDKFQVADHISYISTGGGAFLEFVEGKVLPAVAILESRAS